MTTIIPSTPSYAFRKVYVPYGNGNVPFPLTHTRNIVVPQIPNDPVEPVEPNEFFPPIDDWFFYGYRYVQSQRNGVGVWEQVPLTKDDVLHPQLGDTVTQKSEHTIICMELYAILRAHLRKRRRVYVSHDEMVLWNIPNQRNLGPDIAVFFEVKGKVRGSFDRSKYGGKAVLVVEVTSPSTRDTDINKHDITTGKYLQYQRIGVPYYVVIDAAMKEEGKPPPILVYRLEHGLYQPVLPDTYGRIWIETVELFLGTYQDRVVWIDAQGKRLPNFEEQAEQTLRAQTQVKQVKTQVKQVKAQVKQETEARKAAEIQALQETEARKAAEIQALQETEARKAAETRANELEEELRRLREQLGQN